LSEKAIALIPTRVAPFWSFKAEAILAQGELSRARTVLEAAPSGIFSKHGTLARIALCERDFTRASVELEAARKEQMTPPWQYLDLLAGNMARAQGDVDGAFKAFDKARGSLESSLTEHADEPALVGNLAWAYAGLGRKDYALRTIQQAVQLIPSWRDATEGPAYAAMQAQIQAWVGNKDAAIEQLSGLLKQAAAPTYGDLKFDPGWDDLRNDQRFEELIAQAAKPVTLE